MLGNSLKGRGSIPSIASRQWAAPRLGRSISSFRPRVSRFATPYGTPGRSPVSGIRFNSTSPANSIPPADASAAATPADAPVSPTTTEQPSDLSNLHDVDINSIPEKIGYLKELGLDYGWGPSAFMEYVIEHIHIWGGLPWWASVAGAGLLIRLVLFKPMLEATDAGAKLHNLKPETQPITEKMLTCSRNGDNAGAMRYRQELSALKKSHGIRTFAPFIPFLQIPFGFGCFRAVRGMAALPVPGLAEESAAWITDLTVPDPYFILPAVSSCLLYYSLKKGGESGTNELSSMSLWKGMLYTFPAVTFLAVLSFPSALQLYFVATGAFGAAQATLTSSDKFRRFAGITIPDRNQAKPDMSNIIRLLQEQQRAVGEAKNRSRSEMQSGQQGISFIDSTINSLKKKQSDARKSIEEMTRELQEKAGRGPEKRADGSVADPPRLSKKERQRADEYEKRRREEEDYKRQERNSIRKQGRGDRHERGSS